MTEIGDKEKKVIGAGDPLFLQASDVPGTVLVRTLLNGDNYVTWSRSMKMALGEKVKLGFINGKISMPEDEESEEFEQWMRVDYMVRSWIHSSLTKDISDSFNFTTTAHELWTKLKESFGECKGPLLFQIQKDIITAEQGNMSISQYYTKMKKLWNEFHSLLPFPECKCGASKKMSQIYDSLKLLQLLNGLNESFNAVKDQLLMTEPLPDVGRTYALLQNVEKQRNMQGNCSNINENSAKVVRKGNFKPGIQSGNSQKQAFSSGKPPYIKIDKSGLKCSECGYNGHTSETCFKLHGTPDWYLEMQEARKAAKRNCANTAGINITKKTSSEVQKDIKGKARVDSANTSYVDKAPGKIKLQSGNTSLCFHSSNFNFIKPGSWIIDIFGESFGLSNPFGGMGGGGGSRFGNSIFGVDDIFSSFGKRQPMNSEPTKAPPIEQKLPCTLEELYKGTTKRMKISRERVEASRKTLPLEEILTINIKPGWKKGTKITFEEKGNEQPNVIPADLVFIIDEKPHDVFTRDGNDLIITQKISLTEALTGYTFCLMTLDGRSLNIPINSVIHLNYEEVVPKEGMPISKAPSRKGNLKIKFDIKFPIRLSAEQKSEFKKLTSP